MTLHKSTKIYIYIYIFHSGDLL